MIYTYLILITSVTSVLSNSLDPATKKACDNEFSNSAMLQSCCAPLDEFSMNIQDCHKECGTKQLTCAVAKCVTDEKYHVSKNGKFNLTSAYALLTRLDKEQPQSRPMNEKIRQECLKNNKYKKYVTYDPNCEVMQYLTCAYVSGLRTCCKFYCKPAVCKQLSKDVKTCEPKFYQYLDEKKSSTCK